jgi:hypothetical protein
MNKLPFKTLVLSISLFACTHAGAQLKNIVHNAKKKTAEKVNDQVDKAVTDPGTNSSNQDNADNSSGSNAEADNAGQSQQQANTTQPSTPVSVTAYQNYDFRAGDKIIFEDNFATDEDGEFPAHWDLNKGQAVVNKVTGVPAFLLTDGNYCQVAPRMKTENYLTSNFSHLTHGRFRHLKRILFVVCSIKHLFRDDKGLLRVIQNIQDFFHGCDTISRVNPIRIYNGLCRLLRVVVYMDDINSLFCNQRQRFNS